MRNLRTRRDSNSNGETALESMAFRVSTHSQPLRQMDGDGARLKGRPRAAHNNTRTRRPARHSKTNNKRPDKCCPFVPPMCACVNETHSSIRSFACLYLCNVCGPTSPLPLVATLCWGGKRIPPKKQKKKNSWKRKQRTRLRCCCGGVRKKRLINCDHERQGGWGEGMYPKQARASAKTGPAGSANESENGRRRRL